MTVTTDDKTGKPYLITWSDGIVERGEAMTRPIVETVARPIRWASGSNPDQPVFQNGSPEIGGL